MPYYSLTKDPDKADYFETEAFKKTLLDLTTAIQSGGIIALTGIVGIGKTVALRRIQHTLKEDNRVLVCKSMATDKDRVNINTLSTRPCSRIYRPPRTSRYPRSRRNANAGCKH